MRTPSPLLVIPDAATTRRAVRNHRFWVPLPLRASGPGMTKRVGSSATAAHDPSRNNKADWSGLDRHSGRAKRDPESICIRPGGDAGMANANFEARTASATDGASQASVLPFDEDNGFPLSRK